MAEAKVRRRGRPKKSQSPWSAKEERSRDKEFDNKREAVIDAAASLFHSKGYEASSLNDLAMMLNITKPTVYYYISSKDDLALEIKRRAQESIIEALETAEASYDDPLLRLEQMLLSYAGVIMSDYGKCLAIISRQSLLPESRSEVEERIARAEKVVFRSFKAAKKAGQIDYQDLGITYLAIFGSLNWLAHWYDEDGRKSAKEVAQTVVQALLNGLKSR